MAPRCGRIWLRQSFLSPSEKVCPGPPSWQWCAELGSGQQWWVWSLQATWLAVLMPRLGSCYSIPWPSPGTLLLPPPTSSTCQRKNMCVTGVCPSECQVRHLDLCNGVARTGPIGHAESVSQLLPTAVSHKVPPPHSGAGGWEGISQDSWAVLSRSCSRAEDWTPEARVPWSLSCLIRVRTHPCNYLSKQPVSYKWLSALMSMTGSRWEHHSLCSLNVWITVSRRWRSQR